MHQLFLVWCDKLCLWDIPTKRSPWAWGPGQRAGYWMAPLRPIHMTGKAEVSSYIAMVVGRCSILLKVNLAVITKHLRNCGPTNSWSKLRYISPVTVPLIKNRPMMPSADIPHHTVTPGKFTWCSSVTWGFIGPQYLQLWRLMVPFNLKVASSLHTILCGNPASSAHFARYHSQNSTLRSGSSSLIAWITVGM